MEMRPQICPKAILAEDSRGTSRSTSVKLTADTLDAVSLKLKTCNSPKLR